MLAKAEVAVARQHRRQPDSSEVAEDRRFSIKDIVTITLAVLAFLISFATYYQTHTTPYHLTMSPPSITQTNDGLASLVVDITAYNSGARPATIEDMRIRTSSGGKTQKLTLHVQAELSRQQPIGTLNLDNEQTQRSVFVPQVVRPDDVLQARLGFWPWKSELPLSFEEVLATDTLVIDVQINGKWHNATFTLPYPDFREKFKPEGVIDVPERGYAPRWFRDQPSFVATGGLLSNH